MMSKYKFVIKGIDGAIKYVSKGNYTASVAQYTGFFNKQRFIKQNKYSITESDVIDILDVSEMVDNEGVDASPTNNQSNHLLVQQY